MPSGSGGRRGDKGSIILTGNRGLGDWGHVFVDPVMAGDIIDRLLHRATVINIKGTSYRTRAFNEQQKA
jgi:DNA replication protein DnaC